MTVDFSQLLQRRRISLARWLEDEQIQNIKQLKVWMKAHEHEYSFPENFLVQAKLAYLAGSPDLELLDLNPPGYPTAGQLVTTMAEREVHVPARVLEATQAPVSPSAPEPVLAPVEKAGELPEPPKRNKMKGVQNPSRDE